MPGDDTIPVSVTVLRVERADAGRLIGRAVVEIDIAGVMIVLHGIRIIATGPRSRGIAAPSHRLANGRLADVITLPPELTAAIARVVLDEFDALRSPQPPPIRAENHAAAGAGTLLR